MNNLTKSTSDWTRTFDKARFLRLRRKIKASLIKWLPRPMWGVQKVLKYLWRAGKLLTDEVIKYCQNKSDGGGNAWWLPDWDASWCKFKGKENMTIFGFTCKNWTDFKYWKNICEHNYCRNPDNAEGGVWCYGKNMGKMGNWGKMGRWEYCDVPACDDPRGRA